MTEIPANAAPIIDHPELPTLPPAPVPLPPASWDEQQQAARDHYQATLEDRTAAMQALHDLDADPTASPAAP